MVSTSCATRCSSTCVPSKQTEVGWRRLYPSAFRYLCSEAASNRTGPCCTPTSFAARPVVWTELRDRAQGGTASAIGAPRVPPGWFRRRAQTATSGATSVASRRPLVSATGCASAASGQAYQLQKHMGLAEQRGHRGRRFGQPQLQQLQHLDMRAQVAQEPLRLCSGPTGRCPPRA